jgi:nicotinamidase/pyrazinamidase
MARGLKIHLVGIDPQNSFMGNQDGTPYSVNLGGGQVHTASLHVPGAVPDMERTAKMIERIGHKIDDIHITLDSHRQFDIAHPSFWMDEHGKQPSPFTIISVADVENCRYTPRVPAHRAWALTYVKALANSGKYALCIWPPHCLIGTWGHNVYHRLDDALQRWSDKEIATVNYVTKGSNPFTEHYGALMAEVADPKDSSTGLNSGFLNMLVQADMIGVFGQASSHCVLETLKQIANHIGDEHIKKFYLLKDCMSPVPAIPNVVDFPAIAEAGLKDMQRLGMTVTNSVDFLS